MGNLSKNERAWGEQFFQYKLVIRQDKLNKSNILHLIQKGNNMFGPKHIALGVHTDFITKKKKPGTLQFEMFVVLKRISI